MYILAFYFRLHCWSGSKHNEYSINMYDIHLRLDGAQTLQESHTVVCSIMWRMEIPLRSIEKIPPSDISRFKQSVRGEGEVESCFIDTQQTICIQKSGSTFSTVVTITKDVHGTTAAATLTFLSIFSYAWVAHL